MKFRYIGEYPSEDSQSLEAYGCVFTPGAEIEIPEKFEAKASGNRFFEVVEDAEARPEYDPFANMSRPELVAMAEERGIHVDGRWKEPRIIKAIKEAN